MALEDHKHDIATWIASGMDYETISSKLKFQNGVERGASVTNIKRRCIEWGINPGRHRRSSREVEQAVASAVDEVGPSYGRRMMKGYLESKSFRASESRVGSALRRHNLPYHNERVQQLRNINPIPYSSKYYGHKLHMDQNEKLGYLGATHVIAVDGYSSRVVAHSTMPVKNNLTIYEKVYREATIKEGMWDTVRTDHGTEFHLTLFMQEKNRHLRTNCDAHAFLQTQSKHNLRVERLWPEINNRVNYPLKTAVVELVDRGDVSLDAEVDRFCTSELLVQVADIGVQRCVSSWNHHSIAGRGVPEHQLSTRQNSNVAAHHFPLGEEAALLYEESQQSSLTRPHFFEKSPFATPLQQEQCNAAFSEFCPDLTPLMDSAVNRNYVPFQETLLHLIHLTSQFSA